MKFNLSKITEEIESPSTYTNLDGSGSHGGRYSLGVSLVFSKNGKRLALTKGLAEKLEIKDTVSVGLSIKNRLLILGRMFENGTTYQCSNASGKPIIYNASLVSGIVNSMELQDVFKGDKTSISFQSIEIDDKNGVAFIVIPPLADLMK